jgi:hypothetical protein
MNPPVATKIHKKARKAASLWFLVNFGGNSHRLPFLVTLLALIGMLAAGCGSDRPDGPSGFRGAVFAPPPPGFLSGPLALFLTNSDGFIGRVTCETKSSGDKPDRFSGQLLGRGTMLLFAPDLSAAEGKRYRGAGLGFIWDVQQHNGFLLSEILQAYAPISSKVFFTNMVLQPGAAQSQPEKLDGHACRQEVATVSLNDGSVIGFDVWRALDLKEFPVRIASVPPATPMTFSMSKIRLEAPSADVFQPPSGFTKYESAEAMLDELAARQQNLRRRGPSVPEDLVPVGPQGDRRYQSGH